MNPRYCLGVLLVLPGLAGCTPPGPSEFYRSALAAHGEFVDSLARVVDEKTAKEKYKTMEKLRRDRLLDVKEGLDRTKFDGNFNKLTRENFQLKNMDPDDRNGMIDGMKAYLAYCNNIKFTNVRLKREIQRLRMVANIEALANGALTEAKQPVVVSVANDFPNLNEMFDSLTKLGDVNLKYVPSNLSKEYLAKLESKISDADLNTILTFETGNLDVKVPGLEPPPLPAYPQWAIDIDQRAKLGLTARPAEKR